VAENNIENTGAAPAPESGAEAEAPVSPGLGSASAGGERPGGGGGPGGGGRFGGNRFGGRGPRRPRQPDSEQGQGSDLVEKVVFINRSAKVVKGGRRFSFSALVVVGDKKGRVGVGLGKGNEVSDAIRKGGEIAKNQMVAVSLKGHTIPHEVLSRYCGAQVLLRPASPGTGVIAGKTVRAVLESVGIKDILSKSLGSKNAANVVKATLTGLQRLRLREDIYLSRGLSIRKKEDKPAASAALPA
jgi:small subunit ribosomal protein S5